MLQKNNAQKGNQITSTQVWKKSKCSNEFEQLNLIKQTKTKEMIN